MTFRFRSYLPLTFYGPLLVETDIRDCRPVTLDPKISHSENDDFQTIKLNILTNVLTDTTRSDFSCSYYLLFRQMQTVMVHKIGSSVLHLIYWDSTIPCGSGPFHQRPYVGLIRYRFLRGQSIIIYIYSDVGLWSEGLRVIVSL